MVYITKSNAKRILEKLDLSNQTFTGSLYDKPIYIFNKFEEQRLLAYKGFMQSPSDIIAKIYKKVELEDSFRYIYEGNAPAYHDRLDCERLTSDMLNFHVPNEIVEKGKGEVIKFRRWFIENLGIFKSNPEAFQMRMFTAFGIKVHLNEISRGNTGTYEKENLSLEEVKAKLDKLIKDCGRFYYANSKNTAILKKYGKRTFLAHKNEPLSDNDTGISDEEIKAFLIDYEDKFKFQIVKYLREYYRISYNPDLAIDKKILDALGFHPCKSCCKNE